MWLMVVVVARKYILIYVVTTIQNLRHVITMGHFGVVQVFEMICAAAPPPYSLQATLQQCLKIITK